MQTRNPDTKSHIGQFAAKERARAALIVSACRYGALLQYTYSPTAVQCAKCAAATVHERVRECEKLDPARMNAVCHNMVSHSCGYVTRRCICGDINMFKRLPFLCNSKFFHEHRTSSVALSHPHSNEKRNAKRPQQTSRGQKERGTEQMNGEKKAKFTIHSCTARDSYYVLI